MVETGRELRSKTCCLCLSDDESSFHCNSIMKSLPLHEMVNFCIGIDINVEEQEQLFSTSICNECVLNINNFYSFKKKILEARELISSISLKHESETDECVDEMGDIIELNEVQFFETDQATVNEIAKHSSYVQVTSKKSLPRTVDQNKRSNESSQTAQKVLSKKFKADDNNTEKITIQMNECLICPAILGDILQLKDHIDAHKDIKCKACNRQFARYSNLKRHFNSVHSKPKPFQCDICGLGFNFSVNLQSHAALHYAGKIGGE